MSEAKKFMREVTGIWIRKIHQKAELLIEFGGSWHVVRILSTNIYVDGNASEIIEMHPSCFELDPVTSKAAPGTLKY